MEQTFDRAVYPRGCVFAFLPPSEKYSAPFVLGRICSKWKRLQNGHIQAKVLLLAPLNAGITSPIVFVYANSSATLSTSSFLCSVQGTITEHADGRERFTLSVRDTAIVLSHRKSRLLAARLDDQATIQTAPSVSKEVPDEKLSYSIVRRERALGGDRYLVRTDEEPCWFDKKDLPDEVILKWKRHPKAKTKKKIPAPTTPKISTGRGRSRSDTQSWIAAIRQILLSAEGGLPTSQILSAFQENYPEKTMERKGDGWKSFIRDRILRQDHRVFFSKRDRNIKGKPIVWALTEEARSEAVQVQQRQAVAEKIEDNVLTDLGAGEKREQTAWSATEPLEETHHPNALLPEREMLVPQGPADDSAVLFKPGTPDPLLFDDFFTAQPDSLVLLPQETLSTQLEQVADQSTEQLEVIESDLPPAQPDPTLLYLHGADVVDEVQKAAPAAIQVPTPVESGRAQDGTTAAESTTEPLVPSDLEKELPSEIVDLVALEFEPTIDTGIDNPELQKLGEKLLAKFPPQEVQEEFLANLAKKAEKSLAGPVETPRLARMREIKELLVQKREKLEEMTKQRQAMEAELLQLRERYQRTRERLQQLIAEDAKAVSVKSSAQLATKTAVPTEKASEDTSPKRKLEAAPAGEHSCQLSKEKEPPIKRLKQVDMPDATATLQPAEPLKKPDREDTIAATQKEGESNSHLLVPY